MKFTTSAVLLAALGLANAKVGSKMTKKAFLRNVIKVDREGKRRLDGQEEDAVLATDSLKFQRCVSLTIGPSDDTGEYLFNNYYAYTQAGTLASKMDLAMFSVCSYDDDGNCSYGGDGGDDELYMTPLANWLGNTYGIHAQAEEAYCEACLESQEFCQGGDEEEAAEEEAQDDEADGEEEEADDEEQGDEENEEEDNGDEEQQDEGEEENEDEDNRRALRKLANYVDCDTCDAKGCFEADGDEENQQDEEEEQNVVEYIEAYLDCNMVELDQDEEGRRLDQGMEMYATWCCNSDGDGVRLCLYLDEECSVEYTGETFYNLIEGSNAADTYSNSKTELGYTLHYPVSCMGEIEYDALEDNDGDGEADEEEEGEEQQEAAEFCQNLVSNEQGNNEEGAEVIALSTCAYGDDEQEEEEENQEDNADEWGDYEYWYQVSANDAANFQTLCYAVQNLNGQGYWTTEEYNEGTYVDSSSADSVNASSLTAAAKAGIAFVVIAAVAALGFVVYKCACKQPTDADPKSFKLVDDRKGSMA